MLPHVTIHFTIILLYFVNYLYLLPHVTAVFIKSIHTYFLQ